MGACGTLSRTYSLAEYLGEGVQVDVTADASPTGIGAFLTDKGVAKRFFAAKLTQGDARRLKTELGSSRGQQIWEALCVLCALRLWAPAWRTRRIRLRVKSDSVVALIMVVKMRCSGEGFSIVARELALDIGEALYEAGVAAHLPGQANTIADDLSRLGEPGHLDVPKQLANAQRDSLPARSAEWWITL